MGKCEEPRSKRDGKPGFAVTLKHKFVHIVLLLDCIYRVGEAKNPGPAGPHNLILGAANPTGALSKMEQLHMLPTGGSTIWGLSEIHLTSIGCRKLAQGLSMRQSPYRYMAGAPAPHRASTESSVGGKQVGTGFLSSVPMRKLHPTWTEDHWNEARFTACTFYLNGRWIHGAVF